jgi:hypothetical protein
MEFRRTLSPADRAESDVVRARGALRDAERRAEEARAAEARAAAEAGRDRDTDDPEPPRPHLVQAGESSPRRAGAASPPGASRRVRHRSCRPTLARGTAARPPGSAALRVAPPRLPYGRARASPAVPARRRPRPPVARAYYLPSSCRSFTSSRASCSYWTWRKRTVSAL